MANRFGDALDMPGSSCAPGFPVAGCIYDSGIIPTGVVTPGFQISFFQDLNGKREVDTNMTSANRLPVGQRMRVDSVGVHIAAAFGLTFTDLRDYKTITENAYVKIEIDGRVRAEGRPCMLPDGYGLAGQTTDNSSSVVTNGLAGRALHMPLAAPIMLENCNEIRATLTFQPRNWAVAQGIPASALNSQIFSRSSETEPQDTGVEVMLLLCGLRFVP